MHLKQWYVKTGMDVLKMSMYNQLITLIIKVGNEAMCE